MNQKGRQYAGPAGDGETQLAPAKCLMGLSGHPMRPIGIGPLCFSFIGFIEKDKYFTLLSVRKLLGHQIEYNIEETRHTVMP